MFNSENSTYNNETLNTNITEEQSILETEEYYQNDSFNNSTTENNEYNNQSSTVNNKSSDTYDQETLNTQSYSETNTSSNPTFNNQNFEGDTTSTSITNNTSNRKNKRKVINVNNNFNKDSFESHLSKYQNSINVTENKPVNYVDLKSGVNEFFSSDNLYTEAYYDSAQNEFNETNNAQNSKNFTEYNQEQSNFSNIYNNSSPIISQEQLRIDKLTGKYYSPAKTNNVSNSRSSNNVYNQQNSYVNNSLLETIRYDQSQTYTNSSLPYGDIQDQMILGSLDKYVDIIKSSTTNNYSSNSYGNGKTPFNKKQDNITNNNIESEEYVENILMQGINRLFEKNDTFMNQIISKSGDSNFNTTFMNTTINNQKEVERVMQIVDNIIEQKIRENNDKHAEHFITKNQLKVYKETIIQEIEKKTDLKMEVLSTDVNKRILNNIQESMNRLLRS